MDKLTAIKIKHDDGTYPDEIPISVLSENVEWDSTHTLVDVLGSIDVDVTGTIQDQISQLFNDGGGGGADWNAQEGESGYIANKPFYADYEIGDTIFEETTASLTLKDCTTLGDEFASWSGWYLGQGSLSEGLTEYPFASGDTVKATVDGQEYILVAESMGSSNCWIGCKPWEVYDYSTGTPTPAVSSPEDLPYLFQFCAANIIVGEYSLNFTIFTQDSTKTSVTVKLEKVAATYHKIDPNYIPTEGFNTTASGGYSHAEGGYTTASGIGSHAEGGGTTASGDYSHAEGSETTASDVASHAEGESTTASGGRSHAEGVQTTASGEASHAEGTGTTASGGASHAEGESTTAFGIGSHAEGHNTTASGNYSHAEGDGTKASARFSHAEGLSTKASSASQHVQGKYNVEDAGGTYAHIVGNGTSEENRSNAYTLDWSGNAHFAGSVTADGGFVGEGSGGSSAVTSVNGQTGAVVISEATTSIAGLMSATDKANLDAVYADYSAALIAVGV